MVENSEIEVTREICEIAFNTFRNYVAKIPNKLSRGINEDDLIEGWRLAIKEILPYLLAQKRL